MRRENPARLAQRGSVTHSAVSARLTHTPRNSEPINSSRGPTLLQPSRVLQHR